MKRFLLDFLRRGALAAGIGPVVLAAVYLVLEKTAGLNSLTASQVAVGILSLTALAFVAGGLNALYGIERLSLMAAVLIHGGVLYLGYLATYLLNGWLEEGWLSLLIFTVIFVVGYLVIWAVIYAIVRKSTARINEKLHEKQTEK